MITLPPNVDTAVLASLPEVLKRSVRGQNDAIDLTVEIFESREREMRPPQGCREALLYVGSTGSGKSELAKTLGQALYGVAGVMQLDAPEFALPESLEVALGDGRNFKGRLAAAYDQVPRGLWIIEEIEKGSTVFKNLLIQMIYEGRVTLASGRVLDFSDIYIIATSNVGSTEILERENLPFESLEEHIAKRLEEWFLPELLARFEAFVVFHPLEWDTQREITRKRLDELVAWHRRRHQRDITYDEAVVEFLLARGFSPRYGARPLQRTIDRFVSRAILLSLRNGGNGGGRLVIKDEELRVNPQ